MARSMIRATRESYLTSYAGTLQEPVDPDSRVLQGKPRRFELEPVDGAPVSTRAVSRLLSSLTPKVALGQSLERGR